MKKFKILAMVCAFAFTLTVALAAKLDDSGTNFGGRATTCNTPESLNEGTCYTQSTGAECTIAGTGTWAYENGMSCGGVLKVTPN